MLATLGAQLLVEVVERMADGPVPEEPQPTTGVDLRATHHEGGAPIVWWRPAGRDPQPGARRSTRGRWPPPRSTARACSCVATDAGAERGAGRRAARHGARARTAIASSSRPATATVQLLTRASRRASARWRRASFLPATRVPPGDRAGMIAPARVGGARRAVERVGGRRPARRPGAHARRSLADERDRALAAAIVTGTLRWRARLDYLLPPRPAAPLDSLDADRPRHPAPQPVSAPLPRARARRRPWWTMRCR